MQALTLLNDPVFFECAEALGKTLLTKATFRRSRRCHRRTFPTLPRRDPDPAEGDALRSAHADFLASSDPEARLDRDRPRCFEPRRIHHPRMSPESPLFSPHPRSRREFFTSGASGLGGLALASMLRDDGLLAAESQTGFKAPHFAPKAKNCIYFFMEGGPSQMDLFDPKPKLNELDGQPLPPSVLEKAQFAFIQKEEARLMGSPRTFKKYGQCGMDLSDLLPHLSTCVDDIAFVRSMYCDQFNHLPGQLLMLTGSPLRGWPTLGSWLNYGLGSDSRDLPGYVVLTTLGRGLPGGAASWSSGFLPTNYAGSLFRSQGSPVLNLDTPDRITPACSVAASRRSTT